MHNRLAPNLVASRLKHLFYFCEVGLHKWRSRVLVAHSFSWVCSQGLAGVAPSKVLAEGPTAEESLSDVSMSGLSVLTTWQLASLRASDPKKGDVEAQCSLWPGLGSPMLLFPQVLSFVLQGLMQCRGGLYKDTGVRRQEPLRAMSEAGYHSEVTSGCYSL